MVLEAPDHVLLVRSQGKMIDPQTGGESNMTAVTDPQNVSVKKSQRFLPTGPEIHDRTKQSDYSG